MEQAFNELFLFPKVRIFTDYGNKRLLADVLHRLGDEKIDTVVILDINIDNYDFEAFTEFRKRFRTLLIDHHPANPALQDTKDIIKTNTEDCASLLTFFLARGLINDMEGWSLLVCAAMISDHSFKRKENEEFIARLFPGISPENYRDSKPGKICGMVSAGLSLLDAEKVYAMVIDRDIATLTEIAAKVQRDIERCVKLYKQVELFYPERNLHYGIINPLNSRIASFIANCISNETPNETFVIMCFEGDFVRVSARNQSHNENMNELMKRGVAGLEDASGGGHKAASGACFRREDLNKFLDNILRKE
ncbi:MAG: DHHA1 domain-containing protein [Candidatus Woesearchaeota archaeon]